MPPSAQGFRPAPLLAGTGDRAQANTRMSLPFPCLEAPELFPSAGGVLTLSLRVAALRVYSPGPSTLPTPVTWNVTPASWAWNAVAPRIHYQICSQGPQRQKQASLNPRSPRLACGLGTGRWLGAGLELGPG